MAPRSQTTGTTKPGDATTRERLIDAAALRLASRGPRGVELRSLCIELGISPSLVNYHFASPGELLWLAAVKGYELHVEQQHEAVRTAPSGERAVELWIRETIAWKRSATGVAAIIDYPMLAFSDESEADLDQYARMISDVSRRNVATLGSAVYALMKARDVRMLSAQRVAMLIKTNRDFAYWMSVIGFGGQGAATWIAGRRPYSALWKIFGFSPDRQINATISELVARAHRSGGRDLPSITDE